MKLFKLHPTSNSLRHKIKIEKNLLCKKNNFLKIWTKGKKKFEGRSSVTGRITVWHKGGGCKNKFRCLLSSNSNKNSIVLSIAYDPVRSSFISLNFDLTNKACFYTFSTNSIYPGTLVRSGIEKSDLKLGYRTLLKNIPTGSVVHNISSKTKDTQYARAAGTSAQIVQSDLNTIKIRLSSNKIVFLKPESYATLGVNSNILNNLTCLGKAGSNRLKGKRPTVRGVAMNPVDHPHGGRTNGGRPSVSPWGKLTKGKPTRKKD